MVTDLEMGVLEQLRVLCEDKIVKDIVDVVQEMMGNLEDEHYYKSYREMTEYVSEYATQINDVVSDAVYNDRLPKKKIEDYTVINFFKYGNKEIFLGENLNVEPGSPTKYVVGESAFNGFIETYDNCIGCDNYNEVVGLYSQRINDHISKVKDKLAEFPYDRGIIGKDACDSISGVNLKGKVIVIKGDIIKPEFAGADRQLCIANGGFGCSPEGSGTKVFCTNLYTGEEVGWHRGDILGTIKPECMPEWAKERLAEIEKGNTVDDLISDAKLTCEEVNKEASKIQEDFTID